MRFSWNAKISSLLGILFVLQAFGGSSSAEVGEEATFPLRWGEELLNIRDELLDIQDELLDIQDDALDAKALFLSGAGDLSGSRPSMSPVSDDGGDLVKFVFDWGDGTVSETGFVDPGTVVTLSHIWDRPGVYTVRVRAEDVLGATSEWSEPQEVTIVQRGNRVVGIRRLSIF